MANYAINPSPLPISAAGVGMPPRHLFFLLLLPLYLLLLLLGLLSLSEEVRDNAPAGPHNFPGSSSSSAATRHHLSSSSAIPRNTTAPPPPPLVGLHIPSTSSSSSSGNAAPSPLFSRGALVSVPSKPGAGRAQLHQSSQTAQHQPTHCTAPLLTTIHCCCSGQASWRAHN